MQLLVSPSKLKDIDKLISLNINSFLFGIKHLSLYHNFYIDIKELKTIRHQYPNIEIFVSLNKLMHNRDLKLLKKTLNELKNLNIKGILYDDVAILNMAKNLNLVWAGTHLVTNYHTINTLEKEITGALLSSEITLPEIMNIKKNATVPLIVPIYGYQIMTSSKRHLISNYKKHTNLTIKGNTYYLKNDKDLYPVIEDEHGTHILSSNILNGINELAILKDNHLDYLYLSSLHINSTIFNKIVNIYQQKLENKEVDISKINILTPNNSTLFFYKETYFKVMNNE